MSAKPPRIKVWLSHKLECLAPKLQVLTSHPLYQKAQLAWQVQWQQHRRRTVISGAVLLLVIVAWNGWSFWQKLPKAPPPLPVTLLVAEPTSVPYVIEVMAQAEGANETEVRARVGGILVKRLYEEGQKVSAGQPLFQIDPEPFRIKLEEAQAKATQTAREATRLKKLYAQQAVSRKEMDDAISANDIAQANLKEAQLNLQWTTVTAPVSGVAGRANRSEGNLISTAADGSLLTTLHQVNPIWIRFGLSDNETASLPGGRLDPNADTTVQLVMDDGSLYSEIGKINFQSTFIDPKLGTQQLRATFANPDEKLLPGQFLRARISTGKLENIYLIPQAAVIQSEKGFMVWVIGEDGKVIPTPIKPGAWSGKDWIILGGLQPGMKVVVDNIIKIRPGATVVAAPVNAAPAAK
ncbi:efflux RND transporter periplasmic adaptor subunit [Fluviibacter phosphoraccumulans]|uniref:MexE family multidrug efflux RND transporter periplasmic adaptor subunit n=1 Tax=Fluviibacter phosphoraccumulans TaxID=1751046 RepID=A0A679HU16_9RHOO|nr:efflux RND transporter periplasmic adaptor subunit [Fluviibacter phosphoraccumulans]BBU69549.1 MexE family multidrug efflux RND transporter periplasmic adaptor subunit [Fluviibacter phosphoraccumulans]BBU71268.1 MexE family multidrug efflux RND transporter periplasmic adaptor subunit [Fluviibacter phosphoraccumulans]BCA65488.1 MexE family multidrug efflux RND transporter periplasmic adaptor subunit [Fluviibacter phosphoraccumulans]